ncbi:unnamed protein product [Urochloa humidicola]
MASGSSRGRGSRARGGAPPTPSRAAAPAPAAVYDPQLASLPATDLVARLIGCNRRASDFVDVALVLAARERRHAEAEARARAAEEDAARLRREIAAEAQIRRLVVETELGLRAEIRAWQGRAAQAEARLLLQAHAHAHAHAGGVVAENLTGEEEGKAQAAEEEGRREVAAVSGKRKEAMALSPDNRLKKLIKLRAEAGSCSNAIDEAEAEDAIDEAKAEDALAIMPVVGRDVHDGVEMETNNKEGAGEDDQPEDKIRGEKQEDFEHANPVAFAMAPGHDLPVKNDGISMKARGMKAAGGGLEPEVGRTAPPAYAQGSGDDESLEMEGSHAAAATSSEATRGLPKEPPRDEERPDEDDDNDKDAPQQ